MEARHGMYQSWHLHLGRWTAMKPIAILNILFFAQHCICTTAFRFCLFRESGPSNELGFIHTRRATQDQAGIDPARIWGTVYIIFGPSNLIVPLGSPNWCGSPFLICVVCTVACSNECERFELTAVEVEGVPLFRWFIMSCVCPWHDPAPIHNSPMFPSNFGIYRLDIATNTVVNATSIVAITTKHPWQSQRCNWTGNVTKVFSQFRALLTVMIQLGVMRNIIIIIINIIMFILLSFWLQSSLYHCIATLVRCTISTGQILDKFSACYDEAWTVGVTVGWVRRR